MPKELLKLDKFDGGINSNANPKDIAENEVADGIDAYFGKKGQIKILPKTQPWSTLASLGDTHASEGYGLASLHAGESPFQLTSGDYWGSATIVEGINGFDPIVSVRLGDFCPHIFQNTNTSTEQESFKNWVINEPISGWLNNQGSVSQNWGNGWHWDVPSDLLDAKYYRDVWACRDNWGFRVHIGSDIYGTPDISFPIDTDTGGSSTVVDNKGNSHTFDTHILTKAGKKWFQMCPDIPTAGYAPVDYIKSNGNIITFDGYTNANLSASTWTEREVVDGGGDGWVDGQRGPKFEGISASLINQLSEALVADKWYMLEFDITMDQGYHGRHCLMSIGSNANNSDNTAARTLISQRQLYGEMGPYHPSTVNYNNDGHRNTQRFYFKASAADTYLYFTVIGGDTQNAFVDPGPNSQVTEWTGTNTGTSLENISLHKLPDDMQTEDMSWTASPVFRYPEKFYYFAGTPVDFSNGNNGMFENADGHWGQTGNGVRWWDFADAPWSAFTQYNWEAANWLGPQHRQGGGESGFSTNQWSALYINNNTTIPTGLSWDGKDNMYLAMAAMFQKHSDVSVLLKSRIDPNSTDINWDYETQKFSEIQLNFGKDAFNSFTPDNKYIWIEYTGWGDYMETWGAIGDSFEESNKIGRTFPINQGINTLLTPDVSNDFGAASGDITGFHGGFQDFNICTIPQRFEVTHPAYNNPASQVQINLSDNEHVLNLCSGGWILTVDNQVEGYLPSYLGTQSHFGNPGDFTNTAHHWNGAAAQVQYNDGFEMAPELYPTLMTRTSRIVLLGIDEIHWNYQIDLKDTDLADTVTSGNIYQISVAGVNASPHNEGGLFVASVKPGFDIPSIDYIQDGTNLNADTSTYWTIVDADGGTNGWSEASPPVYGDSETSSMVNTIKSPGLKAGRNYELKFEVGTAALQLTIGGGSATTFSDTYVSDASYSATEHTVLIPASAVTTTRTHLWFRATTSSGSSATLNNVELKCQSLNDLSGVAEEIAKQITGTYGSDLISQGAFADPDDENPWVTGKAATVVQNGSDFASNWARVESSGADDGWDINSASSGLAAFQFSDNEDASLINTLGGDKILASTAYKLTFTVATHTLNLLIGGATANSAYAPDDTYIAAKDYAAGTHTVYFTSGTTARNYLYFQCDKSESDGAGTIDNVSLTKAGWVISGGVATMSSDVINTSGNTIKLKQTIGSLAADTTYRIKLDVTRTSGTLMVSLCGQYSAPHIKSTSISGTNQVFYIRTPSSVSGINYIEIYPKSSAEIGTGEWFVGSIDNVTVQAVTAGVGGITASADSGKLTLQTTETGQAYSHSVYPSILRGWETTTYKEGMTELMTYVDKESNFYVSEISTGTWSDRFNNNNTNYVISSFASGGNTLITTSTNSNFTPGQYVYIKGSEKYDGKYKVKQPVTANTFNISKTYLSETPASTTTVTSLEPALNSIWHQFDRDFTAASNWANAAGANAFNAYNETDSGQLTVTPDDDAGNRQYATLDEDYWNNGLVSGRTYLLTYDINITAYTKGTLSVGMSNDSYTLQDKNTYTGTTSGYITESVSFTYSSSDDKKIIIDAAVSTVLTASFKNISISPITALGDSGSTGGLLWTQKSPKINTYSLGGKMRISDGNFENTLNESMWFGYIKKEGLFNQTGSGTNPINLEGWYVLPHHKAAPSDWQDWIRQDWNNALSTPTGQMQLEVLHPTDNSGAWGAAVWQLYLTAIFDDGSETLPPVTDTYGQQYYDGSSWTMVTALNDKVTIDIHVDPIDSEGKYIFDPRMKGFRMWAANALEDFTKLYDLGTIDFKYGWVGADGAEQVPWTALGTTGYKAQLSATADIMNPMLGIAYAEHTGFEHGQNINPALKWKSSTIVKNTTFIGNVYFDDGYGAKQYPGRVMQSLPGTYDIFPFPYSIVDYVLDDGDEIMHLDQFSERLLIFKKTELLIVNVSTYGDEFIEETHKWKGVPGHNHVVNTPDGVIWLNNYSVYQYDGRDVKDLMENTKSETKGNRTISRHDWENFVSSKSILAYDPKNNQVICKKATSGEGSGDVWVLDLDAGGWSFGLARFAPCAPHLSMANTNAITLGNGEIWILSSFVLEADSNAADGTGVTTSNEDTSESLGDLSRISRAHEGGNIRTKISTSAKTTGIK